MHVVDDLILAAGRLLPDGRAREVEDAGVAGHAELPLEGELEIRELLDAGEIAACHLARLFDVLRQEKSATLDLPARVRIAHGPQPLRALAVEEQPPAPGFLRIGQRVGRGVGDHLLFRLPLALCRALGGAVGGAVGSGDPGECGDKDAGDDGWVEETNHGREK